MTDETTVELTTWNAENERTFNGVCSFIMAYIMMLECVKSQGFACVDKNGVSSMVTNMSQLGM